MDEAADTSAADPRVDGFEWRSNSTHHDAQEKMGRLPAYYEWVLELFGGVPPSPVVDAGAGSGHMAAALLAHGVERLVLLEGGQHNLATLEERFGDDSRVEVVEADLTTCGAAIRGAGAATIVTMDVLEHLPDDELVLAEFHRALPSGGRLLIKVPSLQWLYGPVDEASGHYRRYHRQGLRDVLERSGFSVERCAYMNLAGVGPYFVKSRVLKRRSNFSRTFSETQLRRIEQAIPVVRRVDRLTGPPVGLSLIAVAQKRDGSTTGAG